MNQYSRVVSHRQRLLWSSISISVCCLNVRWCAFLTCVITIRQLFADEVISVGPLRCLLHPLLAAVPQAVADVVPHGAREQHRILRHHSHLREVERSS